MGCGVLYPMIREVAVLIIFFSNDFAICKVIVRINYIYSGIQFLKDLCLYTERV